MHGSNTAPSDERLDTRRVWCSLQVSYNYIFAYVRTFQMLAVDPRGRYCALFYFVYCNDV